MKWRIGEVARLFDLSTDSLRYYEKEGLLPQHKNPGNGYRNYSYDELVVLMDILFFRRMDVPVRDIRQIVNEKSLPEITAVLQENKRSIEEKLAALLRQEDMLAQVIEQYQVCSERVGEFSIVTAPDFKFKFIGHSEEDLFSVIKRLKKIDVNWMNTIRYVLQVSEEDLSGGHDFSLASLGIGINRDELGQHDDCCEVEMTAVEEGDYFYTILATDYREGRNQTLAAAFDWLTLQGKEVNGPLLGRYMASCHKEKLDYYEVWIAIK